MNFSEYAQITASLLNRSSALEKDVKTAIDISIQTLQIGGRLFFCGNGGSAADAQHWAAELTGKLRKTGSPLSAISLTVDTSAITAIGNDYGFEYVFSRQLLGLGRPGDTLFAISTSGKSRSVLNACIKAREMKIMVIGLTGVNGVELRVNSDVCLSVDSNNTEEIQHVHEVLGHYIMGEIESAFRK